MSCKQKFIKAITKMNVSDVGAVLVENTFKGFSNNSFIDKLEELFLIFQNKGDTSIEVYEGQGICGCNIGRNIFCFVGNKTKNYFALSYQEEKNNYYNLSPSCSEILYDNKPQVSKFYYFSIKAESTSEYKKHQENSNPICEYNAFSSNGICTMETITLWLEKYSILNNNTVALLEKKRLVSKLDKENLVVKKEFERLFGKMDILRKLYNKETYFKQQLERYNEVKNSVSKLEKWFAYQDEYKHKYQLFSSVFYDSRELTHFCLKLDDLILDPNDFKYTLKYLNIIEDNKAIGFEGTIKRIDDLEVFERTGTTRAYTRRKIVLSIDDFCYSEYQVVFTDGRVKQLDNLNEGQFVKVSARLTGGEWESSEGSKKFEHNLYGWRVEKSPSKPKRKENNQEMDMYYKYILPSPF